MAASKNSSQCEHNGIQLASTLDPAVRVHDGGNSHESSTGAGSVLHEEGVAAVDGSAMHATPVIHQVAPVTASVVDSKGIHIEGAAEESPERWRSLVLGAISTLFALSTWFSTNSVAPSLKAELGFTDLELSVLTSAVQLGFVVGSITLAVLNVADMLRARHLFGCCALATAMCNASLVLGADSVPVAAFFAFLKGGFLGGVYPPAMKIISGWFRKNRGTAVGTMVGAVVLGSGSPHLTAGLLRENWRLTVLTSSGLAVAAAFIMTCLVGDGPFESKPGPFNPRLLKECWANVALRHVLIGYFGHNFELYGMWTWIGSYMAEAFAGSEPVFGGSVELHSLLAFCVFLSGAIGCVLGGLCAEKVGRSFTTAFAMLLSAGGSVGLGYLPTDTTGARVGVVIFACLYGCFIVADSAQFSTGVTELVDPASRGSVLTLQTGVGFLFTVPAIYLVPYVRSESGSWGPAFALLAIGPLVGAAAMLHLRSHPDAVKMALGKR